MPTADAQLLEYSASTQETLHGRGAHAEPHPNTQAQCVERYEELPNEPDGPTDMDAPLHQGSFLVSVHSSCGDANFFKVKPTTRIAKVCTVASGRHARAVHHLVDNLSKHQQEQHLSVTALGNVDSTMQCFCWHNRFHHCAARSTA